MSRIGSFLSRGLAQLESDAGSMTATISGKPYPVLKNETMDQLSLSEGGLSPSDSIILLARCAVFAAGEEPRSKAPVEFDGKRYVIGSVRKTLNAFYRLECDCVDKGI